MESSHQVHQFEPVYTEGARILILGSFPSVKSRAENFYYGNEKNRFWKVLGAVFATPPPQTIDEKKQFLFRHKIALWDVIASCDITGSSDSSIKNVRPTDLTRILSACEIEQIYANGAKAKSLYEKYAKETTGRPILGLPSTSPANAAYSLERLVHTWQGICDASTGIR